MKKYQTLIATLLVLGGSNTASSATQASVDTDIRDGFAPTVEALESMVRVEERILEDLPTIDASLLTPRVTASRWTRDLNLDAVASAVADVAPEKAHEEAGRILARNEHTTVRLDAERGYVRYISRERAYQPGKALLAGFGETKALDVAHMAVAELQVPLDEQAGDITVSEVHMAANEKDATGEPRIYVRETMVVIERSVNGIPVVGSELRTSVTNDGRIARLKLRWPEFQITDNARRLRSSREVVKEAVARVVAQEDRVADVESRVVYLPVEGGFVPALEVSVIAADGDTPFLTYVSLAR